MKLTLSKAILCLTALIASTYADEVEPLSDLTLTSCPDTHTGLSCDDKGLLKTATLDDSQHTAPYYRTSSDWFMLVWEAPYRLSWKVRDDETVNITFAIQRYTFTEALKPGQTSYDFIVRDLATKLTSNDNTTQARQMVLGDTVSPCLIYLSHPNGSYGIGDSYLVTELMYSTVTGEFQAQHELGENKVTKKWRLGVGIGVGIGAPVLMLASFLLGRRQGKKSRPTLKMAS